MNTVILTAEDAYNKFLQGIRKVANRTVPPDQFDSWFGDGMLDWLRQKVQMPEFNTKRIEDMEHFLVVTDGIDYAEITPSVADVFPVPNVYSATSSGMLMAGSYPLFLHGLTVIFKDADGLFPATLKRTDMAQVMLWNKYRKATYDRPYYEYRNGKIITEGRTPSSMILSYYRYPKLVSYTNAIDPETNPAQTEEIVQIAVRLFLENRGDMRYKSKLQEMMVTQQGK
jgi:hypothetical protein